MSPKLPKYKYLITYRLSEIIFDLVDAFVLRYLSHLGNLSYLGLKEQMLKCARSIKQNIIEAVSEIASLKSQIKLLGVAYASVEELMADLEDFLRRKNLASYSKNHPKTQEFRQLGIRLSHLSNLSHLGHLKEKPTLPNNLEEAINLILTLCHQLSFLLKRQIEAAEKKFVHQGGYSENLFQKRISHRQSPRLPKSPRLLRSFTLMEILIIIAIIALLGVLVFLLLNPIKQIEKAWDSKRKGELHTMAKVFEDFYNDKNCYPKPSEVCFDQPVFTPSGVICHICGNKNTSPHFSPYLPNLPCDPQSPKTDYLYVVDNQDCPKNYQIYARLSNNKDGEISKVGCLGYSCGSPYTYPAYGYNYGVTSPSSSLTTSRYFYCCNKYNICFECSNTYEGCYNGPLCVNKEKIWGSRDLCRCQ